MGLAKIGGYFAFLNIAVIFLKMFHQSMMNKELHSYVNHHATRNNQDTITSLKVEEFYSYENFTQMHNELKATQIEL